MNCRSAEIYMNALLDDELQVKDSLEVVEHLETCEVCSKKWELNEETRSKLKHFVGNLRAPVDLRNKIFSNLDIEKKVHFVQPVLVAASAVFLLGLGMVINYSLVKIPSISELHNMPYIQLASSDVSELADFLEVDLKKEHLLDFEKASFKPVGANKISKLFNKSARLVFLINKKGEKISLCFLPGDFKMENCHKMQFGGQTFYCGKNKGCHFAYWKKQDKTYVLVSDKLDSEAMVKLAFPLV